MARYKVSYEIHYTTGGITHSSTVLSMDKPSESLALDIMQRQGTVPRNVRIVITKIEMQ